MNSEPPTDDESIPPEAQELIKHRIKSNKTELLMKQSFPFVHDDFIICPIVRIHKKKYIYIFLFGFILNNLILN